VAYVLACATGITLYFGWPFPEDDLMLHLIELSAPAIYLFFKSFIVSGPYRFVRHPGYLAMCVSAICSAIAIGSYLALIPALAFVFVIHRRARLEDAFLKLNLDGFACYGERVSAGLPFIRSS
jgi:hypothetical protein